MNKKVEIEVVKAHELDLSKTYIIEIDNRQMSRADLDVFMEGLKYLNVEGIIALTKTGQAITVREVPKYSDAQINGHGNDDWQEKEGII